MLIIDPQDDSPLAILLSSLQKISEDRFHEWSCRDKIKEVLQQYETNLNTYGLLKGVANVPQ